MARLLIKPEPKSGENAKKWKEIQIQHDKQLILIRPSTAPAQLRASFLSFFRRCQKPKNTKIQKYNKLRGRAEKQKCCGAGTQEIDTQVGCTTNILRHLCGPRRGWRAMTMCNGGHCHHFGQNTSTRRTHTPTASLYLAPVGLVAFCILDS